MKYLKHFEDVNSASSSIDEDGIMELMGSDATVAISIGTGKDFTDITKMSKMIEDYKIMYKKNNEWGGGPTNKEWIKKYYRFFGVSEGQAVHGWKPTVILNIHINNYGIAKIGYSINSKKACSFNWEILGNRITCDDCEGSGWRIPNYRMCRSCSGDGKKIDPVRKESYDSLYDYLNKNIYGKEISYDDTIIKLNLEVEGDFNFDPIRP